MSRRQILWPVLALLGGIGLWQLGEAALIAGKAWLAPILIEQAWEGQKHTGGLQPPWPWADFHPAARLTVTRLDIDQYVLSDPSARSLAFGPVATGLQTAPVLFGHRDTHFRFLKDLKSGDLLSFETVDGSRQYYRVSETLIGDADRIRLPRAEDRSILVLVTCYPFDALVPGGPGRYLVLARKIENREDIRRPVRRKTERPDA